MKWKPPVRPDWVRRLNAHGTSVGGAHHLVPLEIDGLVRAALEGAESADLGCCEGSGDAAVSKSPTDWRTHFDLLVESLETESRLHVVGRLLARAELIRSLRNRRELTALWRARPDILQADLPPPIFVVGGARSGTSILFELLALDPQSRAPAMWEMLHPVSALEGDSRRATSDEMVQLWHDLQPEYQAMHDNSGDHPNECIFITMNTFLSDHWSGCHQIPSYDRHLARVDHRDVYRFHRRFLQTLQQRRAGERWLLKAPSHLFQLPALFDVYPDAKVIQTHRDPVKTIPSTLSLMGTLEWMRCDEVNMAELAPRISKGLAYGYRRAIEFRSGGSVPEDRFVDVRFHDLMADPMATLERLYDELEWSLDAGVARAMRDYLAARPRGSLGRHRYSLEEMGLAPARVREAFQFYRSRFDVPEEDP